MGGVEGFLPGKLEPTLRDHSGKARILMVIFESRHLTVSGGQFFWGGNLLKGNGGVQRFPQPGRKSGIECKGKRGLDCKTYKSSRGESRP